MEEWRTILDYPDYEVSDDGRVRRAVARHNWPAGYELRPATARNGGHRFVMLSRAGVSKKQWVHRLVALAFIGPPPFPKAIVRHGDDIPSHNTAGNLSWGTKLDNHLDRMRNKGWNRNSPKGSRVGGAKLVEADIFAIRKMRRSGASLATIAKKYGVNIVTISDIGRGRTWSHVSDKASPGDITLTDTQSAGIRKIVNWFRNETKHQQVARIFGYAGCGKTTLLKYIISELGLDGLEVLHAAFTGKAALVMTRKGTPASTIHSLIYRVSEATPAEIEKVKQEAAEIKAKLPVLNPAARLLEDSRLRSLELRLADIHKPQFVLNDQSALRDAKLLVLDEVSMVGVDMASDLLAFGKPILVLGDPGQLPPIKGAGAFTDVEPDVMLTEIHRQAGESAIIRLATMARQGDPIPYGAHDGHVWKMRRNEVAPEQLLRGGQVICGRNSTRLQLNISMKHAAGFTGVLPAGGDEKIICLKNRHDLGLVNGMFVSLADVRSEGPLEFSATITTEDGVAIAGRQCFYKGHYDDHVSPDPDRFRRDWKEMRSLIETSWGYAITCHKSQGSQWENVIVYDDGLGRTAEDRARWLYTAITRAEQGLAILD